jgi:hypothetical protein
MHVEDLDPLLDQLVGVLDVFALLVDEFLGSIALRISQRCAAVAGPNLP